MNFIRFHDAKLFSAAVSVLKLDVTPDYEYDPVELTVCSNQIDDVVAILQDNGVFNFVMDANPSDEERDMQDDGRTLGDDEHDQFRHDGEADADALASAGFGTDEDYGSASEHVSDDE